MLKIKRKISFDYLKLIRLLWFYAKRWKLIWLWKLCQAFIHFLSRHFNTYFMRFTLMIATIFNIFLISMEFFHCLNQLLLPILLRICLFINLTPILHLFYKWVISILHHMLVSGAIHSSWDDRPPQTIFLDQLYQPQIFLFRPSTLWNAGIQMTIPLLPTLRKLPEKSFPRLFVQLDGDFLPIKICRVPK